MADERAELDQLRKLKRIRELEAKAGGDPPELQRDMPPPKDFTHRGYRSQVEAAFSGASERPKVVPRPIGEIAGNYANLAGGFATTAALGVPAMIAGAPGDVESIARLAGNLINPKIPTENQYAPTSSGIVDALAGPPSDSYAAAGEFAGNFVSPLLWGKALRGLKSGVNVVRSSLKPDPTKVAGRVLREAAGPGPVTMEAAPLPGMQLTTGQASNNPGLIWMERSLNRSSAEGVAAHQAGRAKNNRAIRMAIPGIGDPDDLEAAATMAKRVEAADTAARAANKANWKDLGLDDYTSVPKNWLQGRVDRYVSGLNVAEREVLPAEVLRVLEKIPDKKTTLGEIQSWREMLGERARATYRAGDRSTGRVIGGLEKVVRRFVEELPELTGNASGVQTGDITMYKAARQGTAEYYKKFNRPEVIRKILGVDSYGADRLPVTATADAVIKTGRGAPEALQSYLRAIGDDADGIQAARNAFAKKFLEAAQTSIPDSDGSRLISASKITKFIDNYRHVIDSDLLTENHRKLINDVQRAADMANRTIRGTPAGGSDTFANLAGERFVEALVGKSGATIAGIAERAPTAIGAALGAPFGTFGAGAGAAIGQSIGKGIVQNIYDPARQQALQLIHQAMKNPTLAQSLLNPVSASPAPVAGMSNLGFVGLAGPQTLANLLAAQKPPTVPQ